MNFFYYEPKLKITFFGRGGGGEGVARAREFFYRGSRSNFFFWGGSGGEEGEDGERWGGGLMDGYTNRPKPICPFNFFEVGGITMHKCKCYGHDKLNL